MIFLALHFHQVLFLLSVILMIIGMYMLDKSSKNTLKITDLFLDDSGKIEGSKFRINFAFMIASIGLIYLLLTDCITEFYFSGYLMAFVIDRAVTKFTPDRVPPTTSRVPTSEEGVQ